MKPALDDQIHKLLAERLLAIEQHFDADVLTYEFVFFRLLTNDQIYN